VAISSLQIMYRSPKVKNTITIASTDTAGNTGSTSITINSVTTGNYLRLISNIESGISPLEVLLRVDGSFQPNRIESWRCRACSARSAVRCPRGIQAEIHREGVYYVTVTASGPDGLMYQDTIAITVLNRNQLAYVTERKVGGDEGEIEIEDIDGSLVYFHDGSKESYANIAFKLILDDLPQIVSDMLRVRDDICEG